MLTKDRDVAIDILKFAAVLLIINSHADVMYPKWQILATGGAIGDCLFLFCSGFTLFCGRKNRFDNYYKRRISRIYPSVFAASLYCHMLRWDFQFHLRELAGGEFVIAIMGYYVLLFFIREKFGERVPLILVLVALVSLVVYVLWFPYKYEVSLNGLYGVTTYYRWIPYFGAMLLGAYIGKKGKELNYHAWLDFVKLIACLVVFYGIQFAAKLYRPIAPWQIVTLLPLMGILIYFYKCCNIGWVKRVYQTRWGNSIIMIIGGLCLESYLIQGYFFTDRMNNIWPLNLLIILFVILLSSYIVRCIARWLIQTFRTENYEWKNVFSLYY